MGSTLLALLPTLLSAAAGWAVRHYQLLGSNPTVPVVPVSPAAPTKQHVSLLQALTGLSGQDALALLEKAALDAITLTIKNAAQSLSQQPVSPPAPVQPPKA